MPVSSRRAESLPEFVSVPARDAPGLGENRALAAPGEEPPPNNPTCGGRLLVGKHGALYKSWGWRKAPR